MAAALLALRVSIRRRSERLASRVSASLLLAAIGLLWTGTARLIELLGATGPWGLYSGPGSLAFVVGLAVAGLSLARTGRKAVGRVLLAISALRATAGLVSMTLFNLLGRDVGANVAATQAGHAVRLLEALCWIALAVIVMRPRAGVASPDDAAEASQDSRSSGDHRRGGMRTTPYGAAFCRVDG